MEGILAWLQASRRACRKHGTRTRGRIGLVVICCGLVAGGAWGAERPPRPNVVLILADDLGFSDLGCYGGEIETPQLDRLAANGLRFSQFYNTARCWPTRAALLTGYYAQQIHRDELPGKNAPGRGIRPNWAPLVSMLLRETGYRTYHSGKWHIDGRVTAGGFDRSYHLEDTDRFFSPQSHFEDDRPLPPVPRLASDDAARDTGAASDDAARDTGAASYYAPRGTDAASYYAATAIADHAIDCLRDHAAEHADKPFFQYIAFTSPHFPLQAPAALVEHYRPRYLRGWEATRAARWQRLRDFGWFPGTLSAVEPTVGPPYEFPRDLEKLGVGEVNRPLAWAELDETQRAFQAAKLAIHAAMVDQMDREIGRLCEQLQRMNAWENTLFLFLSDNGASAEIMVRGDGHDPQASPGSAATFLCLGPGGASVANTPFRRHKTWVHEGGIATPLVAHWPRGIRTPGAWRHQPAHVIDLVPTLLETLGVTSATSVPATSSPAAIPPRPGVSLARCWSEDASFPRPPLWWYHEGNRALRDGDWKLVAARSTQDWELYDLATDRAETIDRAGEQPDRVRRMAAAWEAWAQEIEKAATQAPAQEGPRAEPEKSHRIP